MSYDRRVHATYKTGGKPSLTVEIVRYERAGKWYLEPTDGSKRERVMLRTAASTAAQAAGATVHLGLPGGEAFDRLYRRFAGVAPPGDDSQQGSA